MPQKSTTPATSPATPHKAHIQQLRAFNRFYTQRIGVLKPYLGGELSLAEVRVLYELAHRDKPTASALARDLELDAGYLSRILRRFASQGWVAKESHASDGRQSLLVLTPAGRAAFEPLQQRSRDEAAGLLAGLPAPQQAELVQAMGTVQALLDPGAARPAAPAAPTILLRDPRPGDMGWVIQQHGERYAQEYGWDDSFEALVAGIVADYMRKRQPAWERCWIAEMAGRNVGSVFLVRKSATVAQLRLLLLSPEARGLGLGGRLTDECIAFARSKGYRKMVLWTNSGLTAARAIYAKRGFTLIDSEPYQGFGHSLVGETWAMKL